MLPYLEKLSNEELSQKNGQIVSCLVHEYDMEFNISRFKTESFRQVKKKVDNLILKIRRMRGIKIFKRVIEKNNGCFRYEKNAKV